jgi:hypothetical protein
MVNCSHCKIILEISQEEGSEIPNRGVPLSHFSFKAGEI